MPQRRSRLQDYYEELLDPDPSSEEMPAKPEPEESESWLPSYIPPIEPPTPGLTSGESDGDGRPAPPLDVDPAVQDYERNLYQRLGIAPPNESGESTIGQSNGLSDADESQTEDTPDTNQAKDEIIVQAIPPDIAEVQDDFGASRMVDENSWDRLHRNSNLDLILVRQDLETRPLIFQHCFQHSASRQEALECIYAIPPISDENELRHVEQLADQKGQELLVARGGDSDAENGGDFTVPYGSLIRHEEHLESKYGFQIKWGEASGRTNMAEQLSNLEKAIGYILNYLAKEVYGDESLALEAFRLHFSQSGFGQLEIHLGTESDPNDKGYGLVPLPVYDDEGKLINADVEALRKMYLGSGVDIPTIVHEFGHVIDRSKGFTAYLQDLVPDPADPSRNIYRLAAESGNYFDEVKEGIRGQYSFNLNRDVLDYVIEGFVAKQFLAAELWADLFMTAVLSGEGFVVKSVKDRTRDKDRRIIDDPIAVFETFNDSNGPIFRCKVRALCFDRTVEWEAGTFADAAQWYLPRVILALLSR